MAPRCWLLSLTCLVACDPVLDGSSAGGSTSGSTGSTTTRDDEGPRPDPTQGPGTGSTSSGRTSAAPGETTSSATSSTASPTSSSAETGSSSTEATTTTDASSSSTGEPPDLPDGVTPEWTFSLEGFDGHALEVLDDGRIAVGGQEGDVAVIHVLDPAGALLSSHPIDPLLWDAAPASERVLELDRLDGQHLAVLVSRGAEDDYSVYDGVLEFNVSPGSTGEIGWSALIEGVVFQDEPGSFSEALPGLTEQMITTTEGDIYVAGRALTDHTTTEGPELDGLVFWVQRLDPDSGASLWWHMRFLYDGISNYDVVYWLFVNDALGQVLLQGNDWNDSSGNCFWGEITPDHGEAVATDVSLGTGHEYCWRAAEFDDGSIGAPAGILIAGAHDVHVASGAGVTEYPLDSTDFDDATGMYIDRNDRVFLEGRMQDSGARALGLVDLTDPPSSQILVSWPSGPGFGGAVQLRDVAFGQGDEVLVLRQVDDTTVLEQRTLD